MIARFALAAVLVCCSAAVAEDFKHQESGLQFTLPKGWTCKQSGDRLTIENKDKTLACAGGVIPQENAKAIFANIEKFVDQLDGLDDVEITDGPKKEKVNGLVQTWYEGTATHKGTKGEEEVEWDITIISGGKAILFFIGIGQLDDNEEAYDELFDSIRKIKSDQE
jgi:hypothetical protein